MGVLDEDKDGSLLTRVDGSDSVIPGTDTDTGFLQVTKGIDLTIVSIVKEDKPIRGNKTGIAWIDDYPFNNPNSPYDTINS